MKLTREEMYKSALHDSPELWKLKAIECLEWLVENKGITFDDGWLVIDDVYFDAIDDLSEAIRAAILEVCKGVHK